MRYYEHEQLSLLPMPAFAPSWPEPDTLPAEALERMLAGERLTQPRFGLDCWRLSAYIKELEYLGWQIQRMNVPRPPGLRAGRPIREYWL
ncbi:MAG: helix-turn-helix domain-containing protein, partial [Pseudomonadota bacterium]|nr:helix-turn-helix domain-containing protein [Pseudomonadota bacterium]